MQSMWLCIITCITGGSFKRTRRQFEKDPAAVLKGPGGSFKRTAAVLKGPGGSFKRTRRQFQKDPAAVLKGLGYIFSKHVFVFFGQIWPLWTMKPTSNILPRCNKNSEQHSYICGTIPLRYLIRVKRRHDLTYLPTYPPTFNYRRIKVGCGDSDESGDSSDSGDSREIRRLQWL